MTFQGLYNRGNSTKQSVQLLDQQQQQQQRPLTLSINRPYRETICTTIDQPQTGSHQSRRWGGSMRWRSQQQCIMGKRITGASGAVSAPPTSCTGVRQLAERPTPAHVAMLLVLVSVDLPRNAHVHGTPPAWRLRGHEHQSLGGRSGRSPH